MDQLTRDWTRRQWVGDQARRDQTAGRRSEVEELEAAWTFGQWVGDQGHGSPRATHTRAPESVVDTSGGFSGFGHADSGGQRWAAGYVRPAVTPEEVDEQDETEAVA